MVDQEQLKILTVSYLKNIISDVSKTVIDDSMLLMPFQEIGLDSFRILQIIKRLEDDFSTLPKTLLFENFNINDLSNYFLKKYQNVLENKFADFLNEENYSITTTVKSTQKENSVEKLCVPEVRDDIKGIQTNKSILISEKDALNHHELSVLLKDLFLKYKNEGSVSRGTRNIAPNLFIGTEKRGYFNYCRSKNIILVYAYTGPDDYMPIIAKELHQYCIENNFELNIFSVNQISSVGEVPFSATPFGAVQRITNLKKFSLQGNKMRRLRYQVSKFEGTGKCRTEEYKCGTNKKIDQNIAQIIDKWCEVRTMVNPLIYIVKNEILEGILSPEHRIFLTYLDDILQNVILITKMSSKDNGYLMDLEFYPKEMPLGGLEFAICNIIEILASEGCDLLSLGGTYGVKLAPSANADREVDKILDTLREQNIFNDEGNLQFKNKFRPENTAIYLCRPVENSNPNNVTDIIMMIADPTKMQTSEKEHQIVPKDVVCNIESVEKNIMFERTQSNNSITENGTSRFVLEGEERSVILSDYGYNPLNIPNSQVEYDLKTDSWAQLEMPYIDKQKNLLYGKLAQPVNLDESLRNIFPFDHFILTTSGRTAEHILFKAIEKKGTILQNLLFPTTIFNQIDNGFTPIEIQCPETFNQTTDEYFKSNLDIELLKKNIEINANSIAFVCVEVSNNAAGGYPVSLEHIKSVKDLLTRYSIPLLIDATRIVENARQLIESNKKFTDKSTWDIVREIASSADILISSLTKDFCVDKGGLIALNDSVLYTKLQDLVANEGLGLDIINKKLIAHSLSNRNHIETRIIKRMENVKTIWRALKNYSIPVQNFPGGHCILIDVKQIHEFNNFKYPVASFVAWIFLNTGIRSSAHNVGMQKNTSLNNMVRLSIPVGIAEDQIKEVIDRLVSLFEKKQNIPEIILESSDSGTFGDVHVKYILKEFHNVSKKLVSKNVLNSSSEPKTFNLTQGVESNNITFIPNSINNVKLTGSAENYISSNTTLSNDIAIIGMAGRYPKSKNLNELWENLIQGKDCIESITESRLAQRLKTKFTEKYRGGFIDDVDKFDSLFFNISPREAEILDPQERLFLEVAWETIEDAGYYPEILSRENETRNIGVFVGAVWALYQMVGLEEKLAGNNVSPNSFLWSIANRVSYWMNFSGPSLTIDTACSSSLTAIYLACESIIKGECYAAIAGGVNLDLHQSKFEIDKFSGALSKDGLCRTFGKGANGYVAGEGVGALFLKRLDHALKDGDNIHGVIKSAVVNHGGRTSGYTVPNPHAQSKLIKTALERANIDARSIGYIEAHGTGTELGDPIEISGLTNAFGDYGVDKQCCPIGSVKTNIGHLEAAAGVVAVQKVLLQMRNRQLVPSLHSAELNEFIDFKNSPFYVEQNVEEWKSKEIDGIRYPLRAGVSSFGAGGSNAHILIEHYDYSSTSSNVNPSNEQIFPLSARNEDQLRETAIRLCKFIQYELNRKENSFQQSIEDIGHTLRIGRKSFDYRLVIIARTKEELVERLTCFIDGKKDDHIFIGNVKNSENIFRLLNRKEKEDFVNILSHSGDKRKVSQLWIEGLLTDWQGFNVDGKGKRISLPTYPFANKRHWIAEKSKTVSHSLQSSVSLHPLLDSNLSTFERQIFKKTFIHDQFFIYDHLVSEIPTLPGVAYLDFARKAGELAVGKKVQKIRNVLWVSPITVVQSVPIEVFIELKPSGASVMFEVFSEKEKGKKQLHAQGKLIFENTADSEPEYIDIRAVKARCSKEIDGKGAYPLFRSFGLNLGPSFQVLQKVYKNDEETLGVLQIPDIRKDDFSEFLLHPSILDGSLQAGMAAQLGEKADEMFVPYSIGEVDIKYPLQTICYSYVKEIKDPNSKVSKANVLILDEDGKILVKILDSIGIPLLNVHEKPSNNINVQNKLVPPDNGDEFKELYYSYVWERDPIDTNKILRETSSAFILFDLDEELRNCYLQRQIKNKALHSPILILPGDKFQIVDENTFRINPENKNDYLMLFNSLQQKSLHIGMICFGWSKGPIANFEEFLPKTLVYGVYSLLYLCQTLIEKKLDDNVEILYFFTRSNNYIQPHNEAINGFAKSLQIENPKILCKTIEIVTQGCNQSDILDAILAEYNFDSQNAMTVRYEGNERYIRKLVKTELAKKGDYLENEKSVFKENGVYLITGGVGGLGLIFAEFLAKECNAKLLLTGRSPISAERKGSLENLEKMGAEVLYVPADVSKFEDVLKVVNECKSRFGKLNGIIHSAGVLRDSFLRNKTIEEMAAVLAPKLFGTMHLDEITKDIDLDFFVTFSSLAAVGGNAGQCDYSYANHFMDSFAFRRDQLKNNAQRSGKTISLNWSLWADGGMKLDEQTKLLFKKNLEIKPLSIETGIKAFKKGLEYFNCQLAVLEGVQEKIELAWGLRKKITSEPVISEISKSTSNANNSTQKDDAKIIEKIQCELINIVIKLLKVDEEDITLDKMLLDLGFDSIGLTTYANSINEIYNVEITPVHFFEHPSIEAVSKYLYKEYKNEVLKVYNISDDHIVRADITSNDLHSATHNVNIESNQKTEIRFNKGWNSDLLEQSVNTPVSGKYSPDCRFIDMPIAIVGMSGVMPQSDDMEEFWDNLQNAKNMVTLIPEDRWKWEDYDGDPTKEKNKTNSKWGGFMRTVDKFDPLFFGISPREAEMMDPQQRIFLETVWKTIEDSGQKVSDLAGTKTGLFVGVATRDYTDLMNLQKAELDGYSASGNSHSVLVNRISFLLNLRGPSAPLDTACSSSLVALHRAVESIHSGSCEMAIVGGVQVMLTPAAHISFGMAGMLSNDGKCKTFDKHANGYVRGEGSGAIYLKPLAMAEADGNHIYAVIKATAENHGGRVTTLTAPNPNAQSELLIEAYEKAQIDPTSIGYIECHGTGTSLGDPIEIQALKKSFSELYTKHGKIVSEPHIGLSSVKTNIGHLETAAGIAGILKVLLALKHKQIPALLHFQELNPYINLKDSPFYIVNKTKDWNPIKDKDGKELPRRAGVSSFGFGGANAHIILEEYNSNKNLPMLKNEGPYIVVLSAKNEGRLKAYAESLLTHLMKYEIELADLAYTLQVGRDEMNERLALLVKDIDSLKQKLSTFIENKKDENTFYNNTRNKTKKSQGVAGDENKEILIQTIIENKNYIKLAEEWVRGTEVNWKLLYKTGTPKRLSLPTYPFAKERYWFSVPDDSNQMQIENSSIRASVLHSLVHQNTSTFKEQSFTSNFTGNENFIADYIVENRKLFPWFTQVEMAMVAAKLSGESQVRCIKNVSWLNPICFDTSKEIHVSIIPKQNEIDFAILINKKDRSSTNCSGTLTCSALISEPEAFNVGGIEKRFTHVLSQTEIYSYLRNTGLILGKSYQLVKELYSNETESFSLLQIPEELKNKSDQFGIYQVLIETVFHASMACIAKGNQIESPVGIPASLEQIQFLHPLNDVHFAYTKWNVNKSLDVSNITKLNIQLLDKSGKVLLQVTNLLIKPFCEYLLEPAAGAGEYEPEIGTMYYRSIWTKQEIITNSKNDLSSSNFLVFDQSDDFQNDLEQYLKTNQQNKFHICVVKVGERFRDLGKHNFEINPEKFEDYQELVECLRKQNLLPENIIHNWSDEAFDTKQKTINSIMEKGVFSLLFLNQALLQLSKEQDKTSTKMKRIKFLYLYSSNKNNIQPHHAAISSFVKSAALESSTIMYKCLELQSVDAFTKKNNLEILNCVFSELQEDSTSSIEIRYQSGVRYVKRLEEIQLPSSGLHNLRDKGVYIITGGLGGLGLIFSRYLAQQTKARLVLTGRSRLSDEMKEKIKVLESLGSEVMYYEADISRYDDAVHLIAAVKERFEKINGIIHSAGVLRDSVIQKKTVEEMNAVFAAKVFGTINLDEATKDEKMDFFVMFSSLTAITGNAGQSDYAYANNFLNHYAEMRNQLTRDNKRTGNTISFNWPLWKDGGMHIDKQMEDFLLKTKGIRVLKSDTGLDAFVKGIETNESQILVMHGNRSKINKTLGINENEQSKAVDTNGQFSNTISEQELKDLLEKDLLQMIIKIVRVKQESFTHDTNLTEYGFDSINLAQLFRELSNRYTIDLAPAVFFEYPTFSALSQYLCDEYKGQLIEYYQLNIKKLVPYVNTSFPDVKPMEPNHCQNRFESNPYMSFSSLQLNSSSNVQIAIVGMSGMMPQSENIDAFWDNIIIGKDLITEIPLERPELRACLDRFARENFKTNLKWGGFIKEIDKFDAAFFGISSEDAKLMDPQQRIFLETVWNTIEDAGHCASDIAGTKTGVFVGIGSSDYEDLLKNGENDITSYTTTGTSHSVLPNRISYLLDLRGPSEPILTACSSSLVAIHRAIEAICSGSCEMAIAGGVNALLSPEHYLSLGSAGVLANDGRCKSFDISANGYVRGEGVGAIFLKRLDKAINDGNHIYGVVKSTGVNHSGHATSLTSPDSNAQAELLINVYEKAHLNPNTISYIEAHGTGSLFGDFAEIDGLKNAFKEVYKRRGGMQPEAASCGIGTVKTNIGHLESAAGIAGVIKVLSSMKYKKIPGIIHFKELNPQIKLEDSPFYIVQKTQEWNRKKDENGNDIPLRAGISAFGLGGVNAHIVLEEYLSQKEICKPLLITDQNMNVIIPLSAQTDRQLKQKVSDLLSYIQKQEKLNISIDITSIAYTLQVGRDAMEERLGFLANSVDDLKETLHAFIFREKNIKCIFNGRAKDGKATLDLFNEELPILVNHWISSRNLSKLIEFWVKGLYIDWNKLYGEIKPKRLSLPSYPFAKERYWITTEKSESSKLSHPLSYVDFTDQNINDEDESRSLIDSEIFDNNNITMQNSSMNVSEKIELFLKNEIANLLQMPIQKIDADRTFFELGIDSIGVTNLITKTNHLFNDDLTPEVIFKHKDIQSLTKFLVLTYPEKINSLMPIKTREKTNASGCSMKSERLQSSIATRSSEEKVKQTASKSGFSQKVNEMPNLYNVLVPLQSGGNKVPIFAAPGADGSVLSLQQLSLALGNKQPFFGLQSVGLDCKTPPLTNIEEIAEVNIAALKKIQPNGPYRLVGYSNGGVIIFEMARKLLDNNEKIASLALIDSICPIVRVTDVIEEIVAVSNNIMSKYGSELIDSNKLKEVPENERCEFLFNIMRKKGFNLPKEQFTATFNVAIASDKVCRNYRPIKLPQKIDVVLFRAIESNQDMPKDYGWNQLLQEAIKICDIKATHFSIIEKQSIQEIARKINNSVNNS